MKEHGLFIEEGPMVRREGCRVIAKMSYEPAQLQRGYAGRTLYVNVGTGRIEEAFSATSSH